MITKDQLREYCMPLITRKDADLSFMKSKGKKGTALELASSLMRFDPQFERKLEAAPAELREPLLAALRELGGRHVTPRQLVEKTRGIFRKYSIFLEGDRDPGVWFILRDVNVGDAMLSLLIGPYEKLKKDDSLHAGRLHITNEGDGSNLRLSVSSAAARLAETLDLWLSPLDSFAESERNERMLYRLNDEGILKWAEANVATPDMMGFNFTLLVISMRSAFSRFRHLLGETDSPREFLNEALNDELETVAIHELAHIAESRLNGLNRFPEEKKEHIAYLLAAAYGYPHIAFRSLISHGHNAPKYLSDQMLGMGIGSFICGPDFLAQAAFDMLDIDFHHYHGKSHDEVLGLGSIKQAQGVQFVLRSQMEVIERGMYNPSFRSG